MEISQLKDFLRRTRWEKVGTRRYRKGSLELMISATNETVLISEYDESEEKTIYLPPIDIGSIIFFNESED